jgi:hypothetical protein
MVEEYRDARMVHEANVEAQVWETEREEYEQDNPGITFKEWLVARSQLGHPDRT